MLGGAQNSILSVCDIILSDKVKTDKGASVKIISSHFIVCIITQHKHLIFGKMSHILVGFCLSQLPLVAQWLLGTEAMLMNEGSYHTESGHLLSLAIHRAIGGTASWQNGALYSSCLEAN